MREAYLTGSLEPGRNKPLTEVEQFLLHDTDPEAYTFYDCLTHGLFATANSLGLTSAACPHGKLKCRHVYEVPDPQGYSERHHASQYPVAAPVASHPAPAPMRVLPPEPEQWPPQDDPALEEPAEPELTDIEHYASLQFSAAEVCVMLGLDYQAQLRSPEFHQQMLKGKLIMQAQLRETIFQHAKNGSAPAQAEALKLIRQAEINAAGHNE